MKTTTKEIKAIKLRANLKELFAKEIEKIPGYFEELEPKEKLDYLLKVIPYVLPKVNSVHYQNGEFGEWGEMIE